MLVRLAEKTYLCIRLTTIDMDRVIERKKGFQWKKHYPYVVGGSLLLLVVGWLLFGNHAATLKVDAADFITKPWDNDELVRKLKDVLDMKAEIVTLDEMEKDHIRHAIDHCHGNLSQAAELLGITRQTLYNKMKRL